MKIPKKVGKYKVIVDNSHRYYGTTDTKKHTIIINKKKSLKAGGEAELKDTVKHEVFHAMHPNASEATTEHHLEHKTDPRSDLLFKGGI